jgi:hypothetical protein
MHTLANYFFVCVCLLYPCAFGIRYEMWSVIVKMNMVFKMRISYVIDSCNFIYMIMVSRFYELGLIVDLLYMYKMMHLDVFFIF